MIAYVEPAEGGIPGLVNVNTEDGRMFIDLTMGQLRSLVEREGWELRTQADDTERGS